MLDLNLQLSWLCVFVFQVLCELRELRVLYLHGNGIWNLSEVDKLGELQYLHTITLHANVIEIHKGYRWGLHFLLHRFFPQAHLTCTFCLAGRFECYMLIFAAGQETERQKTVVVSQGGASLNYITFTAGCPVVPKLRGQHSPKSQKINGGVMR